MLLHFRHFRHPWQSDAQERLMILIRMQRFTPSECPAALECRHIAIDRDEP
jgi:hypothetical protein